MVAIQGVLRTVYDAFASVDWTLPKISSLLLLVVGSMIA